LGGQRFEEEEFDDRALLRFFHLGRQQIFNVISKSTSEDQIP
jgi:hypothetical protein